MNCPHCGKVLEEDSPCPTCGIEIQYKDFRGSELLDIKMPSPPRRSGETTSPRSTPLTGGAGETRGTVPKKGQIKKPLLFLFVFTAVTASAVAWYFVLKYLLSF